jgi:hypothetical protein
MILGDLCTFLTTSLDSNTADSPRTFSKAKRYLVLQPVQGWRLYKALLHGLHPASERRKESWGTNKSLRVVAYHRDLEENESKRRKATIKIYPASTLNIWTPQRDSGIQNNVGTLLIKHSSDSMSEEVGAQEDQWHKIRAVCRD